jgi:hypothetical protein
MEVTVSQSGRTLTQSLELTSAVAIFSSREDLPTLLRTVVAAANARHPFQQLHIDVIVNGNRALANALKDEIDQVRFPFVSLNIWFLALPDKAHAWNRYVHGIRRNVDLCYFVDGYAAVYASAFAEMFRVLRANPSALAVSGVQSEGPSAARLLRSQIERGGLCGNLHLLPRATLERLRATPFHLPVGIYRTDSTLAAALYLDLDPSTSEWNRERIVTAARAGFSYRQPSPWRLADWKALARRRLRQARGLLENRAVRDHFRIKRRRLPALPATALELVSAWVQEQPDEARKVFTSHPLAWLAYRQWLESPRLSYDAAAPQLIAEIAVAA